MNQITYYMTESKKYIVVYDDGNQMRYDEIMLPDRSTLNDITDNDIHLAMVRGERIIGCARYSSRIGGSRSRPEEIKSKNIKSLLNTSKIKRIDILVDS